MSKLHVQVSVIIAFIGNLVITMLLGPNTIVLALWAVLGIGLGGYYSWKSLLEIFLEKEIEKRMAAKKVEVKVEVEKPEAEVAEVVEVEEEKKE